MLYSNRSIFYVRAMNITLEEGNDYGLSNYDHIALDGKSVQDNDIVFE